MTIAEIRRARLARGDDLGPVGADGDAGPRTVAAVQAFQRALGWSIISMLQPLEFEFLPKAPS